MQTIARYIYTQCTNVVIVNAHENTGENIFKLHEIIHYVEEINKRDGAGCVAIMHSRFNFSRGV